MSGFYEVWEHYKLGSKKCRPATDYLKYSEFPQELVRGQLPRSHGMSYCLCREVMKGTGDVMGLDLLADNPDRSYADLVKETEGLE